MNKPLVSIIIAVKKLNENLKECLKHCLELDYPDYEIIVLPDEELHLSFPKIRVIPTREVSPAEKRDMAAGEARGEILAFLDDDAYPVRDWLKQAAEHFKDEEVAAVGGPAVTPPKNNLRQKASGLVYENILVSGPHGYRYKKSRRRYIEDYPSCNLLIRKDVFTKLGGFDTKFWPGEDTKLCLEIVHKLGKKIIYDPNVLVYHHRRELFVPHLRQVKSYALHRGYFVKKFPQTSLKLPYFLPSLWVLFVLSGLILGFYYPVNLVFFLCLLAYLLLVLAFSVKGGIKMTLLVFSGLILTHFAYGIYFLKGLFSKKLREER
jgi:cellulose synthase/poly-beta-1,6-N-acetylglucosamine synthase-like glycosyltransferase